jgi:stage V sporulation protein AC
MEQPFTKAEYSDLVNKKSPNSPTIRNIFFAFLVGGLICILGQFITNYFLSRGVARETVASITPILLILLSVILTSLDLYDSIGKFAGAGSIVPITGFANSVASPAIEFKSEGLILGLGAKMFTVAGPVLAYGISASVIFGFIYFLLQF